MCSECSGEGESILKYHTKRLLQRFSIMQFVSLAGTTNRAGIWQGTTFFVFEEHHNADWHGNHAARQLRHSVCLCHLFLPLNFNCCDGKWEEMTTALATAAATRRRKTTSRRSVICNVLASVASKTSDYFIITTRRRALHLLILSGDQGALVALIAPSFLPLFAAASLRDHRRSGVVLLRSLFFSVRPDFCFQSRSSSSGCAHGFVVHIFCPRSSLITDSVGEKSFRYLILATS